MDKVFLTGLLMVFLLGLPGLAGAVTFSDRLPTGDSSNDPLQKIAVTLSDPDGINKDKVYFEVDGFNYALNDPRMSYNEATGRLEYTPIRERDELDKVDVLVSAEDTLGEKGELRFSFTINSIGPAPIDFLSFEAGVLRWAKPLSLDSVAKYKVYRDTSRIKDNGKSAYFLAEATGLNYTDSTREEGKRYFYAVTAVDNAGSEGRIALNVSSDGLVFPVGQPAPVPAPLPFPVYPAPTPFPPTVPYPGFEGFDPYPLPSPSIPFTCRVDFAPKGEVIQLERGGISKADFSVSNGLPVEVTVRFEMSQASIGNGTVFMFQPQSQQLRYGRGSGFKLAPGETTLISLPVKASEQALPGIYLLGIDLIAFDEEGRMVYSDSSGAEVQVFAPLPEPLAADLVPANYYQELAPVEDNGRIEARIVEAPQPLIRIAVEDAQVAPKQKAAEAAAEARAEARQPLTQVAVKEAGNAPAGFFNLAAMTTLNMALGFLVLALLLVYGLIRLSVERR